MSKNIPLGRIAGLNMRAKPSALVALAAMWGLLALAAIKLFKLKPPTAVLTGFLATLFHIVNEIIHHLGHARAADLTGYRMQGVTFAGPIASSVYPSDEPILQPDIHIQRALGGPIFSAVWTAVLAVFALVLKPLGGPAWYLALFVLADNVLIFNIGALLPLGFTDGSTLLEWLPKRSNTRFVIE